jgi:hypothetical protein
MILAKMANHKNLLRTGQRLMATIIFVRLLSGLPFSAKNFCGMPVASKDFIFTNVIPLDAYFTGNVFDKNASCFRSVPLK